MLPTLAVPAALLGLGLLALPILVHMLVRDRAPLVRLPTLRFLQGEPPVALRRSRPDEPLLLALRLLILAVAVVALARPWFPGAPPPPVAPGPTPRVILVDQSPSMTRPTPSGEEARVRAALLADSLAGLPDAGGAATLVLPFGADRSLPTALAQALAFLEARPEPGEVVLVSDFHLGEADVEALDALPAAVGRIGVEVEVEDAGEPVPWIVPLRSGDRVVTAAPAGGGAAPGAVSARWLSAPGGGAAGAFPEPAGGGTGSGAPPPATEGAAPDEPPPSGGRALRLRGSPGEEAAMAALHEALGVTGALRVEGAVEVELRFPGGVVAGEGGEGGEGEGVAGTSGATPPLDPAAADLLLRLATDPVLAEVGRPETLFQPATSERDRGEHAAPVLALELFHPPGSLESALVLGALGRAALPPGGAEVTRESSGDEVRAGPSPDPGAWSRPAADEAVAAWRAAGPPGRLGGAGPGSDPLHPGPLRWGWFLVLLLLGFEALYRRRIHVRRG